MLAGQLGFAIEKTGRGRFRLNVGRPLLLSEVAGC